MEKYIGAISSRKENLPDMLICALYWLWFLWTDLQAVLGEVHLSKQCYSLTSNGTFNGQRTHVQFHPTPVRYVVSLVFWIFVTFFVLLCSFSLLRCILSYYLVSYIVFFFFLCFLSAVYFVCFLCSFLLCSSRFHSKFLFFLFCFIFTYRLLVLFT